MRTSDGLVIFAGEGGKNRAGHLHSAGKIGVLQKQQKKPAHAYSGQQEVCRMTLEWLPLPNGARGYCTKDGRYSVCPVGAEPSMRWEAWKMVPGGAWFAPLASNLESEEFARRVAQLDADS